MTNEEIHRRLLIVEQMVATIFDAVVTEKCICPICKESIRLYLPYSEMSKGIFKKSEICPVCRCLQRHRLLWLYLQHKNALSANDVKPPRILHFAPEKSLFDAFNSLENIEYHNCDIDPSRYYSTTVKADICGLPYQNEMFDIVICSHVLEHITDDKKAISEICRVLKPNGTAYIMIPKLFGYCFGGGAEFDATLEVSASDAFQRERYFGHDTHLRLYGKDFVDKRLGEFDVQVVKAEQFLTTEQIKYNALNLREEIFVCKKSS